MGKQIHYKPANMLSAMGKQLHYKPANMLSASQAGGQLQFVIQYKTILKPGKPMDGVSGHCDDSQQNILGMQLQQIY